MFMVERIPLQLFEEVAGIHELQTQVPVRREHVAAGLQDARGVGIMSEAIAAGDDVHAPKAITNLAGQFPPEEAGKDRQPLATGNVSDVLRNIDPVGLHAEFGKRGQQHTIVAAELQDRPRCEPVLEPRGILLEVSHQGADRARRERIILEEDIRIDRLDDLDQSAIFTDMDDEGIRLFRCNGRLAGEKSPCQRHLPEVETERESIGPTPTAPPVRHSSSQTSLLGTHAGRIGSILVRLASAASPGSSVHERLTELTILFLRFFCKRSPSPTQFAGAARDVGGSWRTAGVSQLAHQPAYAGRSPTSGAAPKPIN